MLNIRKYDRYPLWIDFLFGLFAGLVPAGDWVRITGGDTLDVQKLVNCISIKYNALRLHNKLGSNF